MRTGLLTPIAIAAIPASLGSVIPFRGASPALSIPYSTHVLPLTGKVSRPPTKLWYQNDPSKNIELSGPEGASSYLANITIAGQPFSVIIDTGSSDLWVAGTNISCIANMTEVPCEFGPSRFDATGADIYNFPSSYNFNITYGSGAASGTPHRGAVMLGDVTVPDAEFNIATQVDEWIFDGHSEGLMGFAYKSLTSVFDSSDPADDSRENQYIYLPWFPKAVSEGLVEPYFAVALNRATFQQEESVANLTDIGLLTIGGIPTNESVPVTGKQVTVPNVDLEIYMYGKNESAPAYYTIAVDSWNFEGSETMNTSSPTTILDTGTYNLYAPLNVAAAWNALVDPPAVYNDEQGVYVCDCNATLPSLNVTIAGEQFAFQPEDLISPLGIEGLCFTSVGPVTSPNSTNQTEGPEIYILGDRFLVNVVAAFDVVKNEITVFERVPY